MIIECARGRAPFCQYEFTSDIQARLFIEYVLQGREPRILDDNTIRVSNITVHSVDLRALMLLEPDMGLTLSPEHQHDARLLVPRRPPSKEAKQKLKRKKIRTGSYVTIATLAQQLGQTPKQLRARLRKLKVPKPEHGWAWPPHEAAAIKNKLAGKGKKSAKAPVPQMAHRTLN